MFKDFIPYNSGVELSAGKLLISEPMLADSNFQRSVILLCHHDVNESMGFVLNRKDEGVLSDFVPAMKGFSFPVYQGGPVGLNSLHFIHTEPKILEGTLLGNGIYWSGDMNEAFDSIKTGFLNTTNCCFFIGYSGWGAGQLDAEMDMNSWIVSNATRRLVFEVAKSKLWNASIEELGPRFKNLLNIPLNPGLN